jgi:hypothetical protein
VVLFLIEFQGPPVTAVIFTDSVLKSKAMNLHAKGSWKKRRMGGQIQYELRQFPMIGGQLDLGGFEGRFVLCAISGLAFEDGVPRVALEWLRGTQGITRENPPKTVFFHEGLNSLKELVWERDDAERKLARDMAMIDFEAVLIYARTEFPTSRLVYLGSANFRDSRIPGDEGLFDDRTTTRLLKRLRHDISKVVGKISRRSGPGLGMGGVEYYFENLLGNIGNLEILDRHGHVGNQTLDQLNGRIGEKLRVHLNF